MTTVSGRAEMFKQPSGGFVNPSKPLIERDLGGNYIPRDGEIIQPQLIGRVVDAATRFYATGDPAKAFEYSFAGVISHGKQEEFEYLIKLCEPLSVGKDKMSLIAENLSNIILLASFESCYRAGKSPDEIRFGHVNPDDLTSSNILELVNRSVRWYERNEITHVSIKIPKKSFTKTVTNGDGDYLSPSTLWDMKVSVKPPSSVNTLQILMYAIMGKEVPDPKYPEFHTMYQLGIYNPRFDREYIYSVPSDDVIQKVRTEVIGYQ